MAAVDINRGTSGVDLPSALSAEIWGSTAGQSVVMTASRQVQLPGSGTTIHGITADPVAEWVDETDPKPVDEATIENKKLVPYKLAVIEPFSNEFRRDLPTLYAELVRRLPGAIANEFDKTVFGVTTAPGSDFDQLDTTATTQTVGAVTAAADIVAAYQAVAAAGGDLSAWLASPALVGLLITARSAEQNFDLTSGLQVASILGAPVYKTRAAMPTGTPNFIGFGGDFANEAVYGTVAGVQVDISDQATLGTGSTAINLWQRNMFAVRAEIEVGFRVKNVNHFVSLDDGAV